MSRAQVLEILQKALRLPNLDANAHMGGIRGWDSLRHVKLMLELEKACGITIPVDCFGALTSVEAIVQFLQSRGRLAA